MKVVDRLGPVQAEAQLETVLDKKSRKVVGEEGSIRLKMVYERDIPKLRLDPHHLAVEVNPGEERLASMPVDFHAGPAAGADTTAIVFGTPSKNQFGGGRIHNLIGAVILEAVGATEVAAERNLYLRDDRCKEGLNHGAE